MDKKERHTSRIGDTIRRSGADYDGQKYYILIDNFAIFNLHQPAAALSSSRRTLPIQYEYESCESITTKKKKARTHKAVKKQTDKKITTTTSQ